MTVLSQQFEDLFKLGNSRRYGTGTSLNIKFLLLQLGNDLSFG
jgi:hypothetical protein